MPSMVTDPSKLDHWPGLVWLNLEHTLCTILGVTYVMVAVARVKIIALVKALDRHFLLGVWMTCETCDFMYDRICLLQEVRWT